MTSAIDANLYSNPDSDPSGPWLASDLTVTGIRPLQIFELLGSFPPTGRSWRYTRDRTEVLIEEERIAAKPRGLPFLKRYVHELAQTLPHEKESATELLAFPDIIRDFSASLAKRLAVCPGDLSNFEWRDLERALAAAFEGIGFQTRLTRPAKDGGFDIELYLGAKIYLVEVKHWSAPSQVGIGMVTHFAEVVAMRASDRGLFLSSSGFRNSLLSQRMEIAPAQVALGDGRKIIGLCQRYLESVQGVWQPATDLSELLFLDTF